MTEDELVAWITGFADLTDADAELYGNDIRAAVRQHGNYMYHRGQQDGMIGTTYGWDFT